MISLMVFDYFLGYIVQLYRYPVDLLIISRILILSATFSDLKLPFYSSEVAEVKKLEYLL